MQPQFVGQVLHTFCFLNTWSPWHPIFWGLWFLSAHFGTLVRIGVKNGLVDLIVEYPSKSRDVQEWFQGRNSTKLLVREGRERMGKRCF